MDPYAAGCTEYNGVDRDGDDVRVDLLGSSDLPVETPAALAGSVVAAPSQVVSATAITDEDEKKQLMTHLLKIMMREKNDTVVRCLQKTLMKYEREKELRIQPTIRHALLQKRMHAEEEETAKRHRSEALEEWRIYQQTTDAKAAKAACEVAKSNARVQLQAVNVLKHREHQGRLLAERALAEKTTWLQLEYATLLFVRCSTYYGKFDLADRVDFAGHLKNLEKTGRFGHTIMFNSPWKSDTSPNTTWGNTPDINYPKKQHVVRCSPKFAKTIDVALKKAASRHAGHGHRNANDPVEAIKQLLVACIGSQAREIFVGDKGIRKILHINDFSLDKTFVYAIFMMSKFLGEHYWPCGVFGSWPPEPEATVNVEPRDRVSASSSSSAQPS